MHNRDNTTGQTCQRIVEITFQTVEKRVRIFESFVILKELLVADELQTSSAWFDNTEATIRTWRRSWNFPRCFLGVVGVLLISNTLGSSLEYRKKAMIGYNGQKVSHYAVHGILGFLASHVVYAFSMFSSSWTCHSLRLSIEQQKISTTSFYACQCMVYCQPCRGYIIVFFVALGKKNVCSLPDHPKLGEPISCYDQFLVNYNYLGWMVLKSGLLVTKPSNIYLQLSDSFVHWLQIETTSISKKDRPVHHP